MGIESSGIPLDLYLGVEYEVLDKDDLVVTSYGLNRKNILHCVNFNLKFLFIRILNTAITIIFTS